MTVDELEKAITGKGAEKKLRLSIVLEGKDAEIVRAAMTKVGVNGSNRGFARDAILFYLKAKLAAAEKTAAGK